MMVIENIPVLDRLKKGRILTFILGGVLTGKGILLGSKFEKSLDLSVAILRTSIGVWEGKGVGGNYQVAIDLVHDTCRPRPTCYLRSGWSMLL